jgi:hypothetical protein
VGLPLHPETSYATVDAVRRRRTAANSAPAWAEHKVVCEALREGHKRELAAHEARGGRKKDLNKLNHDTSDWFAKIPGLTSEIELLAWKHRTEAPFIIAETVPSDVDGSEILVDVLTRETWEHLLDSIAMGK